MWIVTNNELCHIGIPRRSGRYPFGSGKRPFQSVNDGAKKEDSKQQVKVKINNEKNGKKIDKVRGIGNDVNTITRTLKRRVGATSKNQSFDTSSMSDADLQKAINRLGLEQRYSQLMNQQNMSRGQSFVNDLLDTVGDVATIGASVATIYLSIKAVKG